MLLCCATHTANFPTVIILHLERLGRENMVTRSAYRRGALDRATNLHICRVASLVSCFERQAGCIDLETAIGYTSAHGSIHLLQPIGDFSVPGTKKLIGCSTAI